jgi:hypothetical protein
MSRDLIRMQLEKALRLASASLFGAAVVTCNIGAADAGNPPYAHITVQSDLYPSQTISGAVRRGPRGDEVRLPGGTWVPCGFNCYFTLRNATIDFWRRYDIFPR